MNERVTSRKEPPPPPPAEDSGPPLPNSRLERIRGELQFDKNQLDKVLERQGKDFMDVADAVAMAVSRRDAAKDELKEIEAEILLNVREASKKDVGADGKAKKAPTVDEMNAEVFLHPDVKSARNRLRDHEETLKRYEALAESFRQRSYAIKEFVTLEVEARGKADSYGPRGQYADSRERSRENYRR